MFNPEIRKVKAFNQKAYSVINPYFKPYIFILDFSKNLNIYKIPLILIGIELMRMMILVDNNYVAF